MRDARVDFTLANPPARSAYLTYEPYYGLKEKPFSLSADPRFLYKSRTHAPVFDALRSGIRRREGIIVLTGEPGTGKTTLCRSVLEALDRKTFCTFVPDPFVSREDLLKMLLIDFGVMSVDDLKSGRLHTASRPELSYPLYDFLKSLVPLQAYAVLILDEAQNLTSQLLEEIRILADLEGPEKLLQLVLVGQPELHDKLKDPAMRQVDQRISVRCSLETLEADAIPAYIEHRITVAGGGGDRVEFAPEALELLYSTSKGNPRVLNLIADKSLNRGHQDRTWVITPEIVSAAIGDLGYARPAPTKPPPAVEVVSPAAVTMPTPVLVSISVPDPDSEPALENILPDFREESDHVREENERVLQAEPVDPGAAVPQLHGGRRLRHAAVLTIGGLMLAVAGLSLNEWELRRFELSQPLLLPVLPAPPRHPIAAGAAPVIPPADFFVPVKL
jgi:general secretion pathway protein A